MSTQVYTALWNKYRPVILKLMMNSEEGPQQYQLFAHEFKNLNPKEKGGYSFTLQVFQGKAKNNIKNSTLAQELLQVLEMSRKASELMEADSYEFSLDKKFVLHVSKVTLA
jgi:hypothetical protein